MMEPKSVSKKMLLSITIFFLSSLTYAQVGPCPPGMSEYPSLNGVPSCGPIHSEATHPNGHWEDRWGAYVFSDDENGITGWSSNQFDANSATKMAMENCVSKGGTHCKVSATFRNTCIATVTSDGEGYWATDVTQEKATKKATKSCRASGEKNCRLFRAECSPAKWVTD